ncbi:macrophage migration inhibitory factor isoform X1 [Centropristis striata]|uniref:macrophage migration inhibitory factor isoform X1 n=1 Tax=Centropristis striata TaxID=184440 RepID=UPI0027DF155C|nr:macrophage migration inhibitory factor isoform X1 [Centropristis striata]
MSDYLTREFRAQLTTSMDSVLRRAVFEIMMIFDNSLHDHQMELKQKGEEIAQLIIKLQSAEIKLKEIERGVDGGVEMNKTQMTEIQTEPVNAAQQTSDVPEIDFEVPDDWCAPMGCETSTKQDVTVCPTIRLRKLSIPLCPIPVIKQEVVDRDIDSYQEKKVLRRSKRSSSLKQSHKQTQDGPSPMDDKLTSHTPMRNNMKKLIQDIKQEYADLTGGTGSQRRLRRRKEESKISATEPKEKETVTNDSEKRYACRFCKNVFDTEFGRSVHVQSHKRCSGRKIFPVPSALGYHTAYCKKIKKLKAKEARFSNLAKPDSCEDEKQTAPSIKQVSVNKKITRSSSNNRESSIQTDGPIKKYSCEQCNKAFNQRYRLAEHSRVHTGEKPYPCSMCPKKFRVSQSRKKHIMRIHKYQTNSSEINGDLAWTMPLEEIDDDQKNLTSHKTDKSQAVKHDQRDSSSHTSPSSRWKSMGTRCSKGFACLLCQTVSKNVYLLIEHFRIHTGEKPLKCDKCPEVFRTRGQLSVHRKRCCKTKKATKCAKCGKNFSAQEKYSKHMFKCHKEWPFHCKVCGKGFFLKWRLSNHMERLHK